ncbi:MAG: cell envelope integrity protein CreD [Bacteroidetes bacterium]|nr:cell envelope integrity protein CreD [Bacteroidota bacterium]MCL1969629.1 cell envelope integrity protein CreD [Bacteroidota bacterium]
MEMFVLIFLIIVLAIGLGLFFVARLIYIHYFKNKIDMETPRRKFTESLTFKGITIAILILILLIPSTMIQNLIKERQDRSRETVQKINDKWSHSQTLCAPLLLVPYTTTKLDKDKKPYSEEHTLYVTPKDLKINTSLTPEERYYGIYKAILYKSDIHFEGNFSGLANLKIDNSEFHLDKAQIAIGITDLRGVTQNPDFKIGGKNLETTVGVVKLFSVYENVVSDDISKYGSRDSYSRPANISGKTLIVNLKDIVLTDSLFFDCTMKLNGSGAISFIPIGQNTAVTLNGQWQSPSFIGSFSPESTVDNTQFNAVWNILSFNREIPETWSDNNVTDLGNNSFGVNLIQTVDHYQQNMRSAKYALMFIVLTFIVFFFVEIFTKKPIQFFQYVLVGIALILFYSLLLSLSEQIGFGWAYLTASAATILMTTIYFYSLIKQKLATFVLAGIMIILYAFLYIILQVEDFALLFGSIFLFVILGVIMFVSNKIKLGKQTPMNEE